MASGETDPIPLLVAQKFLFEDDNSRKKKDDKKIINTIIKGVAGGDPLVPDSLGNMANLLAAFILPQ